MLPWSHARRILILKGLSVVKADYLICLVSNPPPMTLPARTVEIDINLSELKNADLKQSVISSAQAFEVLYGSKPPSLSVSQMIFYFHYLGNTYH